MIDRDHIYIDNLYKSIIDNIKLSNIPRYIIFIVTRDKDKKTIEKWSKFDMVKIMTVQHYEIKNRHNYEMIAYKRNIIRLYALINKYDYLWFIDSDIKVESNYLNILLNGLKSMNAYMSYIPYNVKWLNFPAIANIMETTIDIIPLNKNNKDNNDYKQCDIVGFGMTLLHKSLFIYNIEVFRKEINNILFEGEDFGFCITLYDNHLKVVYKTNLIAHHF